jgi:hypothetical protein
MINGLAYMPMNILAAKHMPRGVEATMYSLQMGLWNFGDRKYTSNGVSACDLWVCSDGLVVSRDRPVPWGGAAGEPGRCRAAVIPQHRGATTFLEA